MQFFLIFLYTNSEAFALRPLSYGEARSEPGWGGHETLREAALQNLARQNPFVLDHIQGITERFGCQDTDIEVLSIPDTWARMRLPKLRRGSLNYVYYVKTKNILVRMPIDPQPGYVEHINAIRDMLFGNAEESPAMLPPIFESAEMSIARPSGDMMHYPYVVTAYVEGKTVIQALNENPNLALCVLKKVLAASFHMQKRLISAMDYKHENFLITGSNGSDPVQFIDYLDVVQLLSQANGVAHNGGRANDEMNKLRVFVEDIFFNCHNRLAMADLMRLEGLIESIKKPFSELDRDEVASIYETQIFPFIEDTARRTGLPSEFPSTTGMQLLPSRSSLISMTQI